MQTCFDAAAISDSDDRTWSRERSAHIMSVNSVGLRPLGCYFLGQESAASSYQNTQRARQGDDLSDSPRFFLPLLPSLFSSHRLTKLHPHLQLKLQRSTDNLAKRFLSKNH